MHWRNLHISCVLLVLVVPAFTQTSTGFTSLSVSSVSSAPYTARERHLQNPGAGVLYTNSAFAHGFRHGYERGFGVGDFDLQMGRTPRLSFTKKEYAPTHREYDLAFGSRELFDQGYRAGFRSGYSDAMAGLEFQASERAKSAAAGLNAILPESRRRYFDEGVASGYNSARSPQAPQQAMTAEYLEQYCRANAPKVAQPLDYCSGFAHGYLLGARPDNPIAPQQPPTTLAQK